MKAGPRHFAARGKKTKWQPPTHFTESRLTELTAKFYFGATNGVDIKVVGKFHDAQLSSPTENCGPGTQDEELRGTTASQYMPPEAVISLCLRVGPALGRMN